MFLYPLCYEQCLCWKCVQQTYCVNIHCISLDLPPFRKLLSLQCYTSIGNENPNFSFVSLMLYEQIVVVSQRSNHWPVKHDFSNTHCWFMVLSSYTMIPIKLCMLTTTSTSVTEYTVVSCLHNGLWIVLPCLLLVSEEKAWTKNKMFRCSAILSFLLKDEAGFS